MEQQSGEHFDKGPSRRWNRRISLFMRLWWRGGVTVERVDVSNDADVRVPVKV